MTVPFKKFKTKETKIKACDVVLDLGKTWLSAGVAIGGSSAYLTSQGELQNALLLLFAFFSLGGFFLLHRGLVLRDRIELAFAPETKASERSNNV